MSIWRLPSSRNWSIWFCNLWGQFLSDYTLLYIFGKLWRFRCFWWLFCSISMCIHKLMSVSRLSKFQAFISPDYWFLLQIHVGLVRRICIFVIRLKEYSFFYMEKYLKCVFKKYLVIVTTMSNLSYYWICDTSIIRPFSRFPNVSY
jgi:hypothetical protein